MNISEVSGKHSETKFMNTETCSYMMLLDHYSTQVNILGTEACLDVHHDFVKVLTK